MSRKLDARSVKPSVIEKYLGIIAKKCEWLLAEEYAHFLKITKRSHSEAIPTYLIKVQILNGAEEAWDVSFIVARDLFFSKSRSLSMREAICSYRT